MLLQGVEPAARIAHLPARRTAGRPLPDPAAQPYGRSLLRAAGLQPPRRRGRGDDAAGGHVAAAFEGNAAFRGARHQTPTRTGRLRRRRHRPQGGGSRSDGGHLLHADALFRAARCNRRPRLVLRARQRAGRRGARRTAAYAGLAQIRRAEAPARRIQGALLPVGGGTGDRGTHRAHGHVLQKEEARPLHDAAAGTPERLRHLGSHRRGRVVRTQRVRLPRQHDLRAAPHRPRADDHRRADSHHARFVSRIPHAAAPAAARSDLRGAGAKVYRAARHGRHAEYRHRHRGRDGKTLGRRHRRKRAGTPPGSTVVERRADQGGQRRDDPRLHREDARNAGHGTKGIIPWAQTCLYGRRKIRGNGQYAK